MTASRTTGRPSGPGDSAPEFARALALAPMLAGVVLVWSWVLAVVFIAQPDLLGDPAQSCMLCGTAAALAAFALADRRGGRGPETHRLAAPLLGWAVALALIAIYLPAAAPAGEAPWIVDAPFVAVPEALRCILWALVGALAAYPLRRAQHLFVALARKLGTVEAVGACAGVAVAAGLVALMAAHMTVAAGTVFILIAPPLACMLLPQGVPLLAFGERDAASNAAHAGAREAGANPGEQAMRVTARTLALGFAAVGLTCGFHTVAGRAVFAGESQFNLVFLAVVAAGLVCATVVRRFPRQGAHAAMCVALACCAVTFAPLLFLDGELGGPGWELVQDALVFLSAAAIILLFSAMLRTPADSPRRAHHSWMAAAFFTSLAAGWLTGMAACAVGGPQGIAFKFCATACIALLVAGVLVLEAGHAASIEVMGGSAPESDGGKGRGATAAERGLLDITPSEAIVATDGTGTSEGDANTQANEPLVSVADGATSSGDANTSTSATDNARLDDIALRFGLSERERIMLGLLAEGLSSQQIAERLTVSRNTVKSHTAHIYTKCGVHTRAELDELIEG